MSPITPLPNIDAPAAGLTDDLVITEFGPESAEFADSRICICWMPAAAPRSAADGCRLPR
ncbi:hypothetical protein AB0C89_17180 [Streptomyces sp. NPDC048491]|uniref:hypothetical protein n=1 Tax=Streptomyces TaxID=1883 RepID=UPI000C27C731|nr:hypothetical protein [Streptomyces sp. CB01201]PJM99952.1 hypothetical protein CG740_27105 [Streptomyces sp. CB01201]